MGYNLAVADTGVVFSIGGAALGGIIVGIEQVDSTHARLSVVSTHESITLGYPVHVRTLVFRVIDVTTDVVEIASAWLNWPWSHEAPFRRIS